MIAAAVYGVARGAGCALGRLLLVAFPARSAPVRRAEVAAGQSCRGERVGKPAPPAGRRDQIISVMQHHELDEVNVGGFYEVYCYSPDRDEVCARFEDVHGWIEHVADAIDADLGPR
ncbi:MAG: hypothetical protein CMK98_13570 [Pseudomonas sp.]|nr:hypothetical protein [Pseudomonas sp.]